MDSKWRVPTGAHRGVTAFGDAVPRVNKVALLMLAVAVTLPWIASPYLLKVLVLGLLYAYLSSAWNIIGGFGGQLSLGHSLFFGAGSYSVALASSYAGLPAAIGFVVGPVVAALAAWLMALICFRYKLRGLFFAVVTLLLAEIVRIVVTSTAFLNRSQGLNLPMSTGFNALKFTSDVPYFYLVLGLLTVCLVVVACLTRSRLGHQLVALREQEEGAEALGVNPARTKTIALVMSAALTALGGASHASLVRFVQPDQDLSISITLTMIVGALLGGRGTIWGPVVGGLALMAMQEGLSLIGMAVGTTSFYSMIQVFYGALLMLVVLFLPRGLTSVIPATARST